MLRYLIILLFLFITDCKIKSVEEAKQKMQEHLQDAVDSGDYTKSGIFLFHSDKKNLHWKFSAINRKRVSEDFSIVPDQPFHVASIGKLFTAVLCLQLVETGVWKLDDPITKYIEKSNLKNVFLMDGKDYSDSVTIKQLLEHTSGVADYFEHEDFLKGMVANKEKFWTPLEILDYTAKNYKMASKPGEKYLYSDTGYILLGLLLETQLGKSFEEILQEKIFIPLDMQNSYMHLRSKPLNPNPLPISPMMLGKEDMTNANSVSSDWAGGGIISTAEDLLKFYKALNQSKFLSRKTLESMRGQNQFLYWVYYGMGLMSIEFGDMIFFMPKTPTLYGHSGLLGTHLFYSPLLDAYFILSLGSTDDVGNSFQLLYKFLNLAIELEKY